MGTGVGTALGCIFNESLAQYNSNPGLFDSRLEEVTRYVREQWQRVNGNLDPPPQFDEEDIAPQLCEWHRLGGPSNAWTRRTLSSPRNPARSPSANMRGGFGLACACTRRSAARACGHWLALPTVTRIGSARRNAIRRGVTWHGFSVARRR